ncbi:hypothetical protein CSUI_006664 [Cystoisospora suis]|uniref:Uncharacterized protein n=1 Tax=Cystoisospora suis TaxID=483139 RepID=A0A2C6KT88_9APIC|nr:hypothetical protein CSUI_006664 [Cystoisospora suis]
MWLRSLRHNSDPGDFCLVTCLHRVPSGLLGTLHRRALFVTTRGRNCTLRKQQGKCCGNKPARAGYERPPSRCEKIQARLLLDAISSPRPAEDATPAGGPSTRWQKANRKRPTDPQSRGSRNTVKHFL